MRSRRNTSRYGWNSQWRTSGNRCENDTGNGLQPIYTVRMRDKRGTTVEALMDGLLPLK
jgi:hypothetical protein